MSESDGVPNVYAQCDKNQKEKYEKRYEKTWNSAGNAVGHLALAPALRKQSPRPRRKWVFIYSYTRVNPGDTLRSQREWRLQLRRVQLQQGSRSCRGPGR